MSAKRKYYFLGALLAITALVSLVNYNLGMMALTTFVLAYLSKGMRKI